MNENIDNKACDNDAFTSVKPEFQGDIGVSDYNINSDEQINAENQAKDV